MNLGELLDSIRDLYLEGVHETIAEHREDQTRGRLVLEPILHTEDGEPAHEGDLDLPMRADMFIVEGDEAIEVSIDSGSMLDFEPFEFHIEAAQGPAFLMTPFVWDNLEITLNGLDPTATDWSPLTSWFRAWFDDEQEPDEEDDNVDQLGHVVHGMTDPVVEGEVMRLTIDLGSAPVAAFEDLLAALQMLGPTTCEFGTTNAADDENDDDENNEQHR